MSIIRTLFFTVLIFLFCYTTVAFIGWDFTWLSNLGEWRSFERLMFWMMLMVCIFGGALSEVCSRED